MISWWLDSKEVHMTTLQCEKIDLTKSYGLTCLYCIRVWKRTYWTRSYGL